MRDRQKAADLLSSFREVRRQVQGSVDMSDDSDRSHRSPRRSSQKSSDRSASFYEKYGHLEETVDSFTTSDLMYFFREKARENGVKYVIANMKRDMGIFKKLQVNYSQREICLMIEFIFSSNQNYLDKSITQPTVLASSFCNRIYRDSLLWANDEYDPDSSNISAPKRSQNREWGEHSEEESAKIGEW